MPLTHISTSHQTCQLVAEASVMAMVPEAKWVDTSFTNTTLSGGPRSPKDTMQGQHDAFVPHL